jgi:hypothetical protein
VSNFTDYRSVGIKSSPDRLKILKSTLRSSAAVSEAPGVNRFLTQSLGDGKTVNNFTQNMNNSVNGDSKS